jgi:hypothetical protein
MNADAGDACEAGSRIESLQQCKQAYKALFPDLFQFGEEPSISSEDDLRNGSDFREVSTTDKPKGCHAQVKESSSAGPRAVYWNKHSDGWGDVPLNENFLALCTATPTTTTTTTTSPTPTTTTTPTTPTTTTTDTTTTTKIKLEIRDIENKPCEVSDFQDKIRTIKGARILLCDEKAQKCQFKCKKKYAPRHIKIWARCVHGEVEVDLKCTKKKRKRKR